jgi:serine-type D-Ala-D-Ala carboxypeptidase (penicillin-binding protein 5/6)
MWQAEGLATRPAPAAMSLCLAVARQRDAARTDDGASAKVRGVKLRLLAFAAAALSFAAPAIAAAPSVDARSYIVANVSTGEVLLAHDAAEPVPIASITKLMTVLVTLEHAQLDDVVTVTPRAASTGEESIHLRTGERITVHDLVAGALIQSANDAADALADYVGRGDRAAFVALMNAKAHRLGLRDTHFVRPDGLDAPGHVSSARDVLRLAQVAMRDRDVRRIVRERVATIAGGRVLHTWNDLLGRFPGLIGVKTGHTERAGWCQVAAARGRGLTVYAVVLGAPDRTVRNDDLTELLAWGLSRYRVVPVVDASRVYATVPVGWGRRPVDLVAGRRLIRSVRIGRPLVQRVLAPSTLALPVHAGERVGKVEVLLNGTVIAQEPLVATRSVSRPGFGGRASFYTRRTVHHLWSFLT